jgi:hypothetical protein
MNSKPFRLVLTEEQSAAIRESGIRFAIIHPDSYPSPTVGRWVVDLVECDVHQANAACRVAMGLSAERKLKTETVSDLKAGKAIDTPVTTSPTAP